MNKNIIKQYLAEAFLDEAKVDTSSTPGISVTAKMKRESGKSNKDGISAIGKEMKAYEKGLETPVDDETMAVNKFNYNSKEEQDYHDQMEIMNGMEMLQYDRTPDENFKKRALEAIEGSSKMGNNPEWANVVEKGWGGDKEFGKKLAKKIKNSQEMRSKETPTSKMFGDDWEVVKDKGHKSYATEGTKNKKSIIKESLSEKAISQILKMIDEKGTRPTAMYLVDLCLKRLTGGLSASDLSDTAIYANGLDTIEELLTDGEFGLAIQTAKETAEEMVEDEGMGMGMDEENDTINELSPELKRRAYFDSEDQAGDAHDAGKMGKFNKRRAQSDTFNSHVDPTLQPMGDKIVQKIDPAYKCIIGKSADINVVYVYFTPSDARNAPIVIRVDGKGYKVEKGEEMLHNVGADFDRFFDKIQASEIAKINENQESTMTVSDAVEGTFDGDFDGNKEKLEKAKQLISASTHPDKEYALEKIEQKLQSTLQESNKKQIKQKMKRLKFKKEFNGVGNALNLIPESYRVDNKVFEMTDGNESYKIRWEGSLNEGTAVVLTASDKKVVNEDIQRMKALYNYKSLDTLGTVKGKARVDENASFADIYAKTKKLLGEAEDELEGPEEWEDAVSHAPEAKKHMVQVSKMQNGHQAPAPKTGPLDGIKKHSAEAKKHIQGSTSSDNGHQAPKPKEGHWDEIKIKGTTGVKNTDSHEFISQAKTPKTGAFDGIKKHAPEATKNIQGSTSSDKGTKAPTPKTGDWDNGKKGQAQEATKHIGKK